MSTLRKGSSCRCPVRAYTRRSKFKSKSYVKSFPPSKIIRYDMGEPKKTFSYRLDLVSRENIQLRHNALESARQVANRRLLKRLGKSLYSFKLRLFPHQAIRENKMITGAGADRMQTGMAMSFGQIISIAAQVKQGQPVFTVNVDKAGIDVAKEALRLCRSKMPATYQVVMSENKK